jgi:non-specific serine/threonine protein kinase/serine/threonine-protein kinase
MAADSPERWHRISTLFAEAVKLPPERRAGFLQSACEDDADLRRRVEELLHAAGHGAEHPERPPLPGPGAILRRPPDEPEPGVGVPREDRVSSAPTDTAPQGGAAREAFGPYRLLQKIGEGGMGEVWLAEQTEPIRRKVALKVIKAGMDTKQVIARFEAERQALALMDHPGIAKVFDAGETPRGMPYFAMEHVAGEAITTYCDRHRLSMPERLDLFARVCEAVQHAHQKGVIHRDLKPSNVMVTIQGDKPAPKIIDFGVAKATAQRLTERTIFTELGMLIGTPEYMSPEQAEMTGLDVDTRTDVYALGVMLYELLTGALPFESKELREAGFEEIRRRIREVDPPRPSTRVRTLGARSTQAASNRRTDPEKLASRLKGDLDWIVMKALEKDRTRRYGSASDLVADLERHLQDLPVLAGPPGASYRAGKFVRRHRFGVTIASAAAMGMVVLSIVMVVQARKTARERDRAERVSGFLVDLFNVSDPGTARGNAITAREVLDRGAERIDKELGNEPEVQAQLMLTMGWVYNNLGLYENAEPMMKRSVETRRRILGEDHPDTLEAIEGLACLYERQGHYAEAEKVGRMNVAARRRVLGEEHPATLHSMEHLAVVYERQGRYAEALKLDSEVFEADRRVLPENHERTVWAMQNVAADLEWLGRYSEAEKLFRQAFEIRRRNLGADHPDTLWIMNNMGQVATRLGKYDEAERILRETAETRRRVLGPEHPDTLVSLIDLGIACDRQGRAAEAEALFRQTYEAERRILGEDHANTLWARDRLAAAISEQGRMEEARGILVEVLEARRRVQGPENPGTMSTVSSLATVLDQQKHYEEAEKLFRQVLEFDRRVLGPDHPNTLYAKNNLGKVCAEQEHYDEADKLFREALEGDRRVLGPRHPNTLNVQLGLAGVVASRGGRAEALDLIRQAVEDGYQDPNYMTGEPTLQNLHGDPEFERLVGAARENAGKKNTAAH